MGTFYRSKHEFVFVWKTGTAPHVNNFELGQHGRNRTNVWDYAGVNSFRSGRMDELQMHPTVKPVALVADAIKDLSRGLRQMFRMQEITSPHENILPDQGFVSEGAIRR